MRNVKGDVYRMQPFPTSLKAQVFVLFQDILIHVQHCHQTASYNTSLVSTHNGRCLLLSPGGSDLSDRETAIVKVYGLARGRQTPEIWVSVGHLASCLIATGPLNLSFKCKYQELDTRQIEKEWGLGWEMFPCADRMKGNIAKVSCVFTVDT